MGRRGRQNGLVVIIVVAVDGWMDCRGRGRSGLRSRLF